MRFTARCIRRPSTGSRVLVAGLTLSLLFSLHQVPSARAQNVVWRNSAGTVEIIFPADWKDHDERGQMRVYSPTAQEALARFQRRAGGFLPRRDLMAAVYLLTDEMPEDLTVPVIGQMIMDRMAGKYEVIDTYDLPEREIVSYSYRFQHSGDPVSQTVVLFGEGEGRVYMLEVTGHRKDEDLMLGESRQILHSIRRVQ